MSPGPEPELLTVPPSTDLFGAAAPTPVAAAQPEPGHRAVRHERRPTAGRIVTAAAAGLLLSYLFDMPVAHGHPLPVGTLFALGLVGIQALRGHHVLQQCLVPPVAALFFAFGLPLIMTPFAPHIRYVFFLVMISAAVALYEWSMEGM
jgi:hypothetical protein